MTMRMIQGSLEPEVELTVTRDTGGPVPFGQADEVWLRAEQNGVELFLRLIAGSTDDGIVRGAWQEGDTDAPGRIWLDVLAVWPGGRPQWFRSLEVVDVEPLN